MTLGSSGRMDAWIRLRPVCAGIPDASRRQRLAFQRKQAFPGDGILCGMINQKIKRTVLIWGCVAALPVGVFAEDQASSTNLVTSPAGSSSSDTHFGLFNALDHRSQYGKFAFPEPFLVDDSDLEVNEFRLDYVHTKGAGQRSDQGTVELEKGFGQLTLELEVPYLAQTADGQSQQGFANIDVGARYPFQQYVSPNGFIDSTFGLGIEIGIPTQSSVSKNTEIVPKIFNDLMIGDFTLQSIIGYSSLLGPGDDGGLQTFEYGFVFGYTIPHKRFPLPGVEQTIPVFELIGETEVNKDNPGQNSVSGNAALRFNMKSIGRVQPRPGVGFLFPLNSAARQDEHWGLVVSLVFEY